MNFIEATKSCLKKYGSSSGRATRSEYWYFCLFYMGVTGVGALIDYILFPGLLVSKKAGMGYIQAVCHLALFTPGLSVWIRRLHDVGRSGWWCLIVLTIIGIIPTVYWSFKKGDAGTNRFGSEETSGQPAQKNWASIGLACVAAILSACPVVFAPPTSLVEAAQNGQRDIVIQMIEKGADVNEVGLFDMNPLMSAIAMNHADVVAVLLEKGAEFKKKSVNGLTPLVFATFQNNAAIVALLLKHGASVEDEETGGHPALDLAVQKGYKDIADMLQKAADK